MKRAFDLVDPSSDKVGSSAAEVDQVEDFSASNNNDKMHPRNPYKSKRPNFKELSDKYSYLVPYLIPSSSGEHSLDFRNSAAQRALTTALLDNDFGIKIELPAEQLCPTVTSRVNYILWLEDLLCLGSPKTEGVPTIPQGSSIRGVDIGVGASCIYPLLGRAMNQWHFVGTDIDPVSLEWADKNVKLNGWEGDIELRKAEVGSIVVGVLKSEETFSFCMCNPPFFETIEEKVPNPKVALEATSGELATEGGEAAFIGKIVEDSLVLRDRIKWYTSMIGRKVTLKKIQQRLREAKIVNVRTTTFYQGNTTRWAIAWSFGVDGMVDAVREKTLELLKGKTEIALRSKSNKADESIHTFEAACRALEVKFSKNSSKATYTCKLYDNSTWLQSIGRLASTSSTAMMGAGPFIPPKLLLTFTVDVVQLSSNSPITFLLKFSTGDVDLFAELALDFKDHLPRPAPLPLRSFVSSLLVSNNSTDFDVHQFLKDLPNKVSQSPTKHSTAAPALSYEGGRVSDDEFSAAMKAIGLDPSKTTSLIIAVSGGADSMALALLVKRWAVRNGSQVTACVINHGFRAEAESEAKLVASWLEAHGIKTVIERIDWGEEGAPISNQYERAREKRYDLLRKTAILSNSAIVLTAHHADDQIESFFLAMAHMSGLYGLAGMPSTRPLGAGVQIARPFLSFSKKRLLSTCQHFEQPWVEDPSNTREDDGAQRARIRKALTLIPNLNATDILDSIGIFASQKQKIEAQIEAFTSKFVRLDSDFGLLKWPLSEILALDPEVAARLLSQVITFISGNVDYKPRLPQMESIMKKLKAKKNGTVGGALFSVSPHTREGSNVEESFVFVTADFNKVEPKSFDTRQVCRLGNWVIVPVTDYYKKVTLRGLSKSELAAVWAATDKKKRLALTSRCPILGLQSLPAVITAGGAYTVVGYVPHLFDPDDGDSFKYKYDPLVKDIVFKEISH